MKTVKLLKLDLPYPEPGESQDEFMDRCLEEAGDDPEAEDMCASNWQERGMTCPRQRAKNGKTIKQKTHTSSGSGFDFILSDESPDRVGDIIVANGWDLKAFKRNPIALFNHNKNEPIGTWKNIHIDKDKKELTATLEFAEEGTSKRIDEIRSLVEQGVLRATSVGFLPTEMEAVDEKDPWAGFRFLEQELLEVSLVSVPANSNALRITRSLGISEATQKIVFRDQGSSKQRTKAAGAPNVTVKMKEGRMAKKSLAEQIAGFEATRAAKDARMNEIMEASAEKGETLNEEQQDEWDGLANEVKAIDKHLERLHTMEKANLRQAVEVRGESVHEASRSRGGNGHVSNGNGGYTQVRVELRRQVPPGILFARHFIARAFSTLNQGSISPVEAARSFGYFEQTPELEDILKAAVAVGTTTDAVWAKPLVEPTVMASEFIELLKPATIIGRIPGLRRVPFNIKIPREITAASVNWVGEGNPKPVSAMAFDSISLGFTKVAGIVPVTEELFRFSNPAIETLVRDSLIDAVAILTDRDFVDPAKAAVPGISPASITNGVTPVASSGTSADALRDDVAALMAAYAAANMGLSGLVFIMTSQQAVRLSLMRNALGNTEFPGISAAGGTIEGIPVVTSENLPHTGSPSTSSIIIAVNAPEILLADDGAVNVDMSREASLQMDSAPVGETASTVMVSLWQRNMVALKAERMINWMKRRAGAVQYISNAGYK